MKDITLPMQTLYAELVQQAHAETLQIGSLYERQLKGIKYTYLKRSIGQTRRDVFVGRSDEPATYTKITTIRIANIAAKERRKLVILLKAAGFPAPPSILGAALDALNDAGILKRAILVGTAAYQCYSAIIGIELPIATITTQDADIAMADLALESTQPGESFEAILKKADTSFRAIPQLDSRKPASRYISDSGFMIDILTPQYRRTDTNPMPLTKLAAGAAPLQHLDWLIKSPVHAVVLHGAGQPVQIPQPARYAIHKLIIAQKRGTDLIKRQKDLLQSKHLIAALLEKDPWALKDAYQEAIQKGENGWHTPIKRSLKELEIEAKTLKA